MIKIAYLSTKAVTAKPGHELDIYVRESVFIEDKDGHKRRVLPAGTKGKLRIIRIGGLNDDIVMDSHGYIILNGKKVGLKHYKDKRKTLRKVYKLGRYAGAGSVLGLAGLFAGSTFKRKMNKLNLPKKMFTSEALSFSE